MVFYMAHRNRWRIDDLWWFTGAKHGDFPYGKQPEGKYLLHGSSWSKRQSWLNFCQAEQSCTWPTWSEQKGRRVDVWPDLFLEVCWASKASPRYTKVVCRYMPWSYVHFLVFLFSFHNWIWKTRSWFVSIDVRCCWHHHKFQFWSLQSQRQKPMKFGCAK